MPLLLWAAFRFGMRGASLTAAIIAVLATIGTAHGSTPFVRGSVNESLLLLHLFLGVNSTVALFVAGLLAERKKAEEDRLKLESQLLQSQKLEAVGLLAGGVAHDFNNILTIFSSYGDMLRIKLQGNDELKPYADCILEAAEKGADLTKSLLAFSRKQEITLKPINLVETMKKVEKLLHRIIGEHIELKFNLSGPKLIVMADTCQLEQVMMNLATNARDAMPQGGVLCIQTEAVELRASDVASGDVAKPGMYGCISIADSGQGMDKTTAEKIFEPFFTTKEVGKGTGLGLAIVYGIIKQHNGTIRVYSAQGTGTTFKIYLPLIPAAADQPIRETPPPPKGGTETILLAEDNAEVRRSIKIILEDSGYKVIEAADGEAAVAEFSSRADEIGLLLTDVIMPKKNGKEVYDAIKAINPDIKALFITGYAADIVASAASLQEQGLRLINKPPAPDDLKRAIRTLLDAKRG